LAQLRIFGIEDAFVDILGRFQPSTEHPHKLPDLTC